MTDIELCKSLRAAKAALTREGVTVPVWEGSLYLDAADRIESLSAEVFSLSEANDMLLARAEHAEADGLAKAGWLAQLVIDKIGGTDDLPAWVRGSANYYMAAIDRAEDAEEELEKVLLNSEKKT